MRSDMTSPPANSAIHPGSASLTKAGQLFGDYCADELARLLG
ncbi:hypothetical protein ACLBW8_22090 [Pseudomonas sp. M5A4_2d]